MTIEQERDIAVRALERIIGDYKNAYLGHLDAKHVAEEALAAIKRAQALQALIDQAQELDMGYGAAQASPSDFIRFHPISSNPTIKESLQVADASPVAQDELPERLPGQLQSDVPWRKIQPDTFCFVLKQDTAFDGDGILRAWNAMRDALIARASVAVPAMTVDLTELAEWRKLKEPAALHANLLRGMPARLESKELLHLAGDEAVKAHAARLGMAWPAAQPSGPLVGAHDGCGTRVVIGPTVIHKPAAQPVGEAVAYMKANNAESNGEIYAPDSVLALIRENPKEWVPLYRAAPPVAQDQDAGLRAALADVTEKLDRASAELLSLRNPSQGEKRRSGTLYEAMNRAATDLPEQYTIMIELELGYGGVSWSGPDCEWKHIEGEGWLCDDLNEAINSAIAANAKEPT